MRAGQADIEEYYEERIRVLEGALRGISDELYKAGTGEVQFWMSARDKELMGAMKHMATVGYRALGDEIV